MIDMGLTQERIDEINKIEIDSDSMEMPYVYVKTQDASSVGTYTLRVDITWVCVADAVTAFRKIEMRHAPEEVLDIHVSRKTGSVDLENTEVVFNILFDPPDQEIDRPREDVLIRIADK